MKFNAKLADEHLSYIRMVPIKIYYSILEGDIFNLIHIHFSESMNQTTMSLEIMKENEKVDDFKTFKTDAIGNVLYYKILVKKMKIVAVLYNNGSTAEILQFVPVQIFSDKQYTVLLDKDSVAYISQIPIGLLACEDPEKIKLYDHNPAKYNKMAFCNEQHPEEYEGLVDMDIALWLNQYLSESYKISVPICQLDPAKDSQIKKLEELKKTFQFKKENPIRTVIKKLQSRIDGYKKEMKMEEKLELFEAIKRMAAELGTKSSENLSQELLNEIVNVQKKEEDIEKILLPVVRVARMSKGN
jgi:hypothetical protein